MPSDTQERLIREAARVKAQLAEDARKIPVQDMRDPLRHRPPAPPKPTPRPTGAKPMRSPYYASPPREPLTFDKIVRAVWWVAWVMFAVGVLGELLRGQL